MNPIMSNQKREIPSIAHIIELGGAIWYIYMHF
jgi:hypothetical protein